MKKNNEKMVLVEGKWIAESKAEGRRVAIANGRRIKSDLNASLKETHQDEVRQLREAGYTDDEIALHFNAQNAEAAASHGFIRPARVFRETKKQWGPTMMFH